MKILFTDIHHGNGGGHVSYITSLVRGLLKHHTVVLAAPPSGRLFRYASKVPGLRVKAGLYTNRVPKLISEVFALRRFLEKEQFDVVHVNGSADHRHIMLACQWMQRPPAVVWTKHNLNRCTSFGHRLRSRFATTAVIAVSDYVARQLQLSPYSILPIHVIRHGIDLDHFAPVSADRKIQLRRSLLGDFSPANQLVIGSTGGTDLEKGWLDLVHAAAQLSREEQERLVVVVAGDQPSGELLARFEQVSHHVRVVFPGLVDDVRTVLGACDLGFVLSHREALSYAARESLAMGLPTLVSDAGGLPENLVSGRQGWVIPVADHNALSALLRCLLHNSGALSPMGLAARCHSLQEFSLNNFVSATEAVYMQAARTRGRAV